MVTAAEQARLIRWTALVLGSALLVFAAYLFLIPRNGIRRGVVEDLNNVKQMVQTIASASTIHATADGRIDVYRTLFAIIDLHGDNATLLHNNRLEKGPTIAEIRSGDYSNFAWRRALAEDVRGAKGRVPVLWDPTPIKGKRVVGFANGKVEWMTEEEFAGLSGSR